MLRHFPLSQEQISCSIPGKQPFRLGLTPSRSCKDTDRKSRSMGFLSSGSSTVRSSALVGQFAERFMHQFIMWRFKCKSFMCFFNMVKRTFCGIIIKKTLFALCRFFILFVWHCWTVNKHDYKNVFVIYFTSQIK